MKAMSKQLLRFAPQTLQGAVAFLIMGVIATASVYPVLHDRAEIVVTDTRQVLHYERQPGQKNGAGYWYLNWPGTFGVARLRLPLRWNPADGDSRNAPTGAVVAVGSGCSNVSLQVHGRLQTALVSRVGRARAAGSAATESNSNAIC